jgi:hypothetical protein
MGEQRISQPLQFSIDNTDSSQLTSSWSYAGSQASKSQRHIHTGSHAIGMIQLMTTSCRQGWSKVPTGTDESSTGAPIHGHVPVQQQPPATSFFSSSSSSQPATYPAVAAHWLAIQQQPQPLHTSSPVVAAARHLPLVAAVGLASYRRLRFLREQDELGPGHPRVSFLCLVQGYQGMYFSI